MRGRIQEVIAKTFDLDPTLMYLTKPTFFSRINSTAAKTQHDEYWHPHIDKVKHREVLLVLLALLQRTISKAAPNAKIICHSSSFFFFFFLAGVWLVSKQTGLAHSSDIVKDVRKVESKMKSQVSSIKYYPLIQKVCLGTEHKLEFR